MKKLSIIIILIISLVAYCNLPLSDTVSFTLNFSNYTDQVKLKFSANDEKTIAKWVLTPGFFHWINVDGYNLNGPDISIDQMLKIKNVIVSSNSCETRKLNIQFKKEYRPQDFTKYWHHGSKAYMQYTYKNSMQLVCKK